MVKKSGLGKGLNSLFSEVDAEVGNKKETTTLPLKKIKPNKDQPRKRFDEAELTELSDSIKQNGILQPLLVREKGDHYEIVAGERRFQAAKLAKLEEVPVVIKAISDEEVFKLALIENLQRSDLSPIEEAQGYKQLIKQENLTQDDLAKVLSKSRSAITNTLRLLDLPTEVQTLMVEGRIKLAQKVIEENLSVRQTENLAPLFSVTNVEKPKRQPTPQAYKRAARQLRIALDTPVKVRNVRGKNKIEIEFNDEDELAALVEKLSNGKEA